MHRADRQLSPAGLLQAAVLMVFGGALMLVATASRFRWPQHIALAGLVFNLTVAVGLAATYSVQDRCWKNP